MEAPGFSDDLIPSPESLEKEAELTCGSLSTLWGPSLHALKLARNSFQMVLERIKGDGSSGDSSSLRQTTAINVADLGTRLWIAGQVMRAGARHANRRAGRALCLGKSFLAKASLEVCHKAIELLREQGLTDHRLLSNYSAVLEITARNGSAESSRPLTADPS
jgi:alkylation response protein AidB-like acyl-CoA dehydrogenase